jgi:hypothetical protein
MNLPLLALLLILIVAVWLIFRLRRGPTDTRPASVPRPTPPASAYHAVSIKLADFPCNAAQEIAGKRYLSGEAPKLPLPGCTNASSCSCRFVHHKDRRTGKDRRSPFGPAGFGPATGNYSKEQRSGQDRRARDDDDDYF